MNKEQEKIIEQRAKDLSEKANAEEAAERLKPKAEESPFKQYEDLTKTFYEDNRKVQEDALDAVLELYVDNKRQNSKKAEGFGTKLYDALKANLSEHIGLQATNATGEDHLEEIITNYVGFEKEDLDKKYEDENVIDQEELENLKATVERSLSKRLENNTIKKVHKIASKDVNGFKQYVTDLAKKQEVSFTENDTASLEGLFDIYRQSVSLLIQEQLRKKKRK